MKVIILAGGFGTRLSEYTKLIPKPMVPINNKPMLLHIMSQYAKYGYKDFYIALGYKGSVIRKYFKNFKSPWNINLVETGKNTMTGGRLKRFKKIIGNETFMMTYGDGISDVNIEKLLDFHNKRKKVATLTAVRPPARFGAVKISSSNKVKYFKEKSKIDEGWINGGYFVFEPQFFKLIKNDSTSLEREPLEKAAIQGQLNAFKHNGFWQCVNTKRDKDHLEKLLKQKI